MKQSGISAFFSFLGQQKQELFEQTLRHLGLTFLSLWLAMIVAIPLGIFIARRRRWSGLVLGVTGVLQTIPSIALLGFLLPVLGIGSKPAIFALFLYALLPIVRNTFTGITGVDATVREAASAIGMSTRQVLFRVELPLAMPVILAGIRTATVINVGVATLAAYIAGGGLGEFIFGGIALNNTQMILAGAVPAALLAILLDGLLSLVQRVSLRKIMRVAASIVIAGPLVFGAFWASASTRVKLQGGFTPEFMGRYDGYLGLKDRYDLHLPVVVISDAVMYKAAFEQKLDVISGYSTDGRMRAYDLSILDDDQHVFPPYYAAPIVRNETLAKFPEVKTALEKLSGLITDSIMTSLNYQADYLGKSPAKVARDFLERKGLYRPSRKGSKGTVTIGSKIFTEQYILSNMYAMLIEGFTDLKVTSKTGLGGTLICFGALQGGEIDLYPEYTGTGLTAILHVPDKEMATFNGNADKAYQFVKREFAGKYQVSWLEPIGFNNAYCLMMRNKQRNALRIKTISDLKNYLDK
ncbi:MAG: ABC transporter permease/substrate-binding protein [Mucilaginibacter polytrichastri]|nr:ABC transporter permease/substrate-binding protein [Mucilaginibacter polytrichastri]